MNIYERNFCMRWVNMSQQVEQSLRNVERARSFFFFFFSFFLWSNYKNRKTRRKMSRLFRLLAHTHQLCVTFLLATRWKRFPFSLSLSAQTRVDMMNESLSRVGGRHVRVREIPCELWLQHALQCWLTQLIIHSEKHPPCSSRFSDIGYRQQRKATAKTKRRCVRLLLHNRTDIQ